MKALYVNICCLWLEIPLKREIYVHVVLDCLDNLKVTSGKKIEKKYLLEIIILVNRVLLEPFKTFYTRPYELNYLTVLLCFKSFYKILVIRVLLEPFTQGRTN